jgi:hypothetical protein
MNLENIKRTTEEIDELTDVVVQMKVIQELVLKVT